MSSSLISPLFFLTGTSMIFVAVSAVWYWQRGKPSLWAMVWWGVLAWTVSLALKAAAGLPMMNFFQRHADNPMIWLCGGLLTGVFECVPRSVRKLDVTNLTGDRCDATLAIAWR